MMCFSCSDFGTMSSTLPVQDNTALRIPAPFWQVTLTLCLVILAGVGLSFVMFFYTYTQVNIAMARQIERPVVKAAADIQEQINSTHDLLRSLQQVLHLSPDASEGQLGDFTVAAHVSSADIFMVTLQAGQNDRQKKLTHKTAVTLPLRLMDDREGFAKLMMMAKVSQGVMSVQGRLGEVDYLIMAERCSDVQSACYLIALLPFKDLLRPLDVLADNKLITGYSLFEQSSEFDTMEKSSKAFFTRRVGKVSAMTFFDSQIKGDHLVLPDRLWAFHYNAQPDQDSMLVLLLPYLVILIGLLMTGVSAIYVINNHEYQKDVFTLTWSLQTTNNKLQERMAAEATMAQALRLSEQKFRTIFENAGIGICQIAPNKRWQAANPRIAQILGYKDAQEILQDQPDMQDMLFHDTSARQRFLAGLDKHGQTDVELSIRRKDGIALWVNMRGHVVRDEEDEPLYYECTMYDVTQRRLSERALVKAKEQADFANRSKSEFLANMSHELRTPLNAIIGFSEIIKDQILGPEGTPQYIEYAKDIYDSGALLLSLINDILDMSKIEAGKRTLSETSIDIERVVQSCIRLVAVRAKTGEIQLGHNMPSNLPFLRGEERAIKQVLVNLMTNAIKFTPEQGVVTVSASIDPFGRMILAVSDTGIGIAPQDIPTALAPFGQIESVMSRKTQGTGLGLPLTKALIELHGGELQISSELGKGTVVSALFPAGRMVQRQI